MQFHDVVANSIALNYLKGVAKQDHVPHALLFWGPEGSGKLAAALTFSQYLLCSNKNSEPCGVCKHCVKSAKLIHPDLHFMFPTIGAKVKSTDLYPEWRSAVLENPYLNYFQWLQKLKADNKQGNINTADCHRVIAQLSLKTFESNTKVLIIWMAEFLGKEGNRMLKLIEEPPGNTVIVLICENRGKILPTILSRCQLLHFKPFSEQFLTGELKKRYQCSLQKAAIIAASSDGSWNQAAMMASGMFATPVDRFTDWARIAYQGKARLVVEMSNELSRLPKEEQKQLIKFGLKIFNKVLHERYQVKGLGETQEIKLINFLSKSLSAETLETISQLLSENFTAIERNANTRILWTHLTLKMRDAMRGKVVSGVI